MRRRRSTLRLGTSFGLVVAAGLALAGSAVADSSTIAGEPIVVPGHQEFGNCSTVQPRDFQDDSYWGLRTIAGDRVTINWEGTTADSFSFNLYVYPIGTTDSRVDSTQPVVTQHIYAHARNVLRFTAPTTGTMPLQFSMSSDYNPGPFNFTANVLHLVDMRIAGVHRIAPTGRLRIQARDPDGKPITNPSLVIQLQYAAGRQRWRTIGSAHPRHGGAHVRYRLPADVSGHPIRLRARASGGGYFTRTTGRRTVTVR